MCRDYDGLPRDHLGIYEDYMGPLTLDPTIWDSMGYSLNS